MSATPPPSGIEQSILKKVSKRLLPFLAILYVFCLIDRTNVSIAALQMKPALGFTNDVIGTGFGIFFLGYFLFEVPSNLIMEKVGARWWITRIMLTWGALSAAMMFVKSPMSFYSLRFLLGIAEAGFFPGVVLYITYWIPATSRARAMALFLAMTAVFGLFGNPLGALLLKMHGWKGLAGWQWLFLLEGIPSMLLAFFVLAFLPDKPAEAKWLTDAEKQWLAARLEREAVHEHTVKHLTLRTALTEPRILQLCLVFIVSSAAGNAVGAFAPTMIKDASGGRWDDSFVALMMVFPAIAGAVAILAASVHSDRTGRRTQHVLTGYMIGAIGYVACVFAPGPGWIIGGLALFTLGERIGAGSYWALTTNLLGARAAAGGIALINSVGNLGGFLGPKGMGWLLDRTHGNYAIGLYTAAGLMAVSAVIGALLKRQPVHQATEDPAGIFGAPRGKLFSHRASSPSNRSEKCHSPDDMHT
jgi:ACS family tartrate transporter-like MFS transporter